MKFQGATKAYFADAIRRHKQHRGPNAASLLSRYQRDTRGLDKCLAFKALGGGRMFGASDRARYDKLLKDRKPKPKGGQVKGDGSKGDAKVDMKTFQGLLDRLEASKKRQQRQKSVEGRRDIYAGGMASMMSNF